MVLRVVDTPPECQSQPILEGHVVGLSQQATLLNSATWQVILTNKLIYERGKLKKKSHGNLLQEVTVYASTWDTEDTQCFKLGLLGWGTG